MNFQQLETFRWVVHFGSFTKAASKLHTTQSTVSMRISELEQEIGVKVLDRSQRTIRMTPKGRDLLRYAAEIHLLVMELKANVGNPEKVSGSVRLGVAELIALTWLPKLVAELNRLYPKVEIDLEVGLTGDMYDKIRAGEIDLSFLPVEGHPGQGLESILLGKVHFAYMAAPQLIRKGQRLRPRDLEQWPVISLGPNSVLSEIQDSWFRQNKVRPTKLDRSNSMEISAGLVRSGLGISLLPVDYYADDLAAERMVILDVTPSLPPVSFSAIHAAENTSPLVRQIIDLARRSGEFID